MGVAFALALVAAAALCFVITAAAFARFVEPEGWRRETGWARRPHLAGTIERVAFIGLNPLRALIFWIVLTGIVTAFLALPALFYLLGQL